MEKELLEDISNLSVDILEEFGSRYSKELLGLFAFVGKYMTISFLPREYKENIDCVTKPELCPLCIMPSEGKEFTGDCCRDCVLVCDIEGRGCGNGYTTLKESIISSGPADSAFVMHRYAAKLARQVIEAKLHEKQSQKDQTEV